MTSHIKTTTPELNLAVHMYTEHMCYMNVHIVDIKDKHKTKYTAKNFGRSVMWCDFYKKFTRMAHLEWHI